MAYLKIDGTYATLNQKYIKFTLSPTSIVGNVLWLDANDVILRDNQYVSQWTDKSGLGNHALQVFTDKQPSYVPTGLNNRPVLRFDGSDDYLALTDNIVLASEHTLFVVMNKSGNNYGVPFGTTGGTIYYNIINYTNGNTYYSNGTEQVYWSGSPEITTIHGIICNNNNVELFFNGIGQGLLSLSGPYSDIIAIGTCPTLFHFGDIVEIIIYNRALTTPERQQVEDYLNTKYNLY